MSFFKNLFGSNKNEPKARKLTHPRDLRAGDIIKFRYVDQSDVSGKEFEVSQINTYLYGDLCYPELVLKDRSGHIIYLMVEEEDGEEYLALSKKVGKGNVSDVLNQEQLDEITQRGTGTKVKITNKPEGFGQWLVSNYKEVEDNIKGAFIKGDARYLSDAEINKQEKFSSHTLVDKSDEYAIEIELYDTGEVELSATVYLEISEIEEMWPGSVN
jgi:hypothetical protein